MIKFLELLLEAFTSLDGKIEKQIVDDATRKAARELIANGDKIDPDRAFKMLLAFQVDADAERTLIRKRMAVLELRLLFVGLIAVGALVAHLVNFTI
jgi:hypothetical protein